MEQGWTAERIAWLQARAAACGFTAAGVAPVEQQTEREREDSRRISAWLEAGYAGEMDYLKRRDEQDRLLRSAVQIAAPWARSVVICSLNYFNAGPLSTEAAEQGAGWIGRYAWSGRAHSSLPGEQAEPRSVATDYHEVLLRRLRQLEAEIRAELPCQSRCYVDTGPIVERAVAARAGVGWIGKNTTTLNQEIGSWTLLASILTSLPVLASGIAAPLADRCGSCTRCIDACPTDALIAPRQMDARRCIAYLTIEKKGVISPELREGMGRQIFGCDICQDVCPWNRRALRAQDEEMLPRGELINPDLEALAAMSSAEFRKLFRGSPVERTGRKRLQRNVAIAMGNSGQERFRERLALWSSGEDPVLAEAAQWALGRLAAAAADINTTASDDRR